LSLPYTGDLASSDAPNTVPPSAPGRNGPRYAPVAIGKGGCPCCFDGTFAATLEKAIRERQQRAAEGTVCVPVKHKAA